MNIDEQIKQLLQQVGLGELSEQEAEQKYQQLIGSSIPETDAITVASGAYAERSIQCLNSLENPASRLFIFLPFGFGNETLAWVWKEAFAPQDGIEVWVMGVAGVRDWRTLIDHLVDYMVPLCDIPFAVYGHSMGGIVAYETLVSLEQQHGLIAEIFVPSSVSAPTVFERLKVLPPVYEIDAAMSCTERRALLERSQIILPAKSGVKPVSDDVIDADLELIRQYRYHAERQLTCPVLALQANNDVLVKDPVNVTLWKQFTRGGFDFHEVEGTHLYFMSPPPSLFATLRAKLTNGRALNNAFEPAVYRLVSFEQGTEEVHIYPYGTRPDGYLIYQPDGKMAAHLWNSARTPHDARYKIRLDDNEERLLTYLSYTGYYHASDGVIEHAVQAASDPSFDHDCLTRYYSFDSEYMTLTTAPLTFQNDRQSKSTAYCKLVWQRLARKASHHEHWLIGSWSLSTYQEDGESVLGSSPEGVLILTADGYFSLIAANLTRSRPIFDNLVLASRQELNDAVQSCRSFCGRYALSEEDGLQLLVEEGLFDSRVKHIFLNLGNARKDFSLQLHQDSGNKLTYIGQLQGQRSREKGCSLVSC